MPERLLLLTFAFPPTAAPEAFLSAKRMGALPARVVDVVSAAFPPRWSQEQDPSLDAYVAARFGEVLRVHPSPTFRAVPRAARVLVPDPQRAFVADAVRAALKLAARHEYAGVVTWSQWHSVHLAGLEVQRRTRLPWLAHLSDPWIGNPFTELRGRRLARSTTLERRVFERADRLLFTSPQAIALSLAGYPAAVRRKAVALPHAFDASLYPEVEPPGSGPLVLRYLGAFYGRRTPNPLLRALASLLRRDPTLADRLRVEVVGAVQAGTVDPDALAEIPAGVFAVQRPVGYLDSLALMRASHGLVLVDAPATASPFLPSKLIDYIGARRPLAALTPPGPAADATRSVGGLVADPDDADACAAVLARLVEVAARREPFGDAEARLAFDVVRVGAEMEQIVQETVAASSA